MLLLLLIAKGYCSYLLNMFYINDLNTFSRKAILADFCSQFSAHIFYENFKGTKPTQEEHTNFETYNRPCLFRNILFIYFHHFIPVYWNNWGISLKIFFFFNKLFFLIYVFKNNLKSTPFLKMWVNGIYGMHGKHYSEIGLN